LGARKRSDDKARIGLALGQLRLGDDAAFAAPTLARQPLELLEDARRLAAAPALRCGLRQFIGDHRDEPLILRHAEYKVDVVVLAPRHQVVARESRIGAHQDAHMRPAPADLGNDARHRLHRAVRRLEARAPQLGVQQMTSAKHVKRKIAVAVVIAGKEPAFLFAVHRIVGGVEIEDDLAGRPVHAPPRTDRPSAA
jgi:hypothetical protein